MNRSTLSIFLLLCFFFYQDISALGGAVIDVRYDKADCQIVGAATSDTLGMFYGEANSGDLNGDGLDELIVSADQHGRDGDGALYVYRGGRVLAASEDLATSSPSLTIAGPWWGSLFGRAFSIVDFDGDGRKDLVTLVVQGLNQSAPEGGIYVFKGKPDFFSSPERSAASADYIIQGADETYRPDIAFAVGDINADGRPDLAIGGDFAPRPDNQSANIGRVFVIFGKSSWPPLLQLNSSTVDLEIYGKATGGATSYDRLGRTVGIGDVNGDGKNDLVAFAFATDSLRGRGYVMFGRASWPDVLDLKTTPADVTIENGPAEGMLGHSIALADVNADGRADLLFTAYSGSSLGRTRNGVSYILLGRSDWPVSVDLTAGSPGLTTIHGMSEFRGLGWGARAGDFDGDGKNDCLFTGVSESTTSGEGYAVILRGRTNWPATVDLDQGGYDWLFRGGPTFGVGFLFARINEDQREDLVIGDPFSSYGNRANCGKVYVFYGGAAQAKCSDATWKGYR